MYPPNGMLLGGDDRLLPPAVQKWAAQLPVTTTRVVDGDHFLCLTQPELVAEQICTLFDGN